MVKHIRMATRVSRWLPMVLVVCGLASMLTLAIISTAELAADRYKRDQENERTSFHDETGSGAVKALDAGTPKPQGCHCGGDTYPASECDRTCPGWRGE